MMFGRMPNDAILRKGSVRSQARPRVAKVHRLRNEETKQFAIVDHSGE
jgi:hypothetical protein